VQRGVKPRATDLLRIFPANLYEKKARKNTMKKVMGSKNREVLEKFLVERI